MSQSGMTFGTCQHVSSRVQCGPMESGFAVTVNAAQPRHIIPQQACTVGHCGPDGLDHVLALTRPKTTGRRNKSANNNLTARTLATSSDLGARRRTRIESPTEGPKDRPASMPNV